MTPQIGQTTTAADLRSMLSTWCEDADSLEGHKWEFDRESPASLIGQEFPADPACQKCRRLMRNKMIDRGVPEETIRRYFDRVGAKWLWDYPERPVTSEEDILLLGGRYTDWRKMQDAKAARSGVLPETKLGDHIRWVPVVTLEMQRENRKAAQQLNRVVDARLKAIESGASREEAILAHPLQKLPVFRQQDQS